jgi:hypothetical protein
VIGLRSQGSKQALLRDLPDLQLDAMLSVRSRTGPLQDEDTPGQFCSPDDPISDCNNRRLPTIVYPFTEGSNPRKARSFGQLDLAAIEQRHSAPGLLHQSTSNPSSSTDGSSSSECGSPSAPRSLAGGSSEDPETSPSISEGVVASLAEKVLVKEWDRRFERGLFRYDVRECTKKVRMRQCLDVFVRARVRARACTAHLYAISKPADLCVHAVAQLQCVLAGLHGGNACAPLT